MSWVRSVYCWLVLFYCMFGARRLTSLSVGRVVSVRLSDPTCALLRFRPSWLCVSILHAPARILCSRVVIVRRCLSFVARQLMGGCAPSWLALWVLTRRSGALGRSCLGILLRGSRFVCVDCVVGSVFLAAVNPPLSLSVVGVPSVRCGAVLAVCSRLDSPPVASCIRLFRPDVPLVRGVCRLLPPSWGLSAAVCRAIYTCAAQAFISLCVSCAGEWVLLRLDDSVG